MTALSDEYRVQVAAGSLATDDAHIRMPHRWTAEGVAVEADFTGAHLLHLAIAGCVLNDVYREAAADSIDVAGVRVSATGRFETEDWRSTGIEYAVEVDSDAPPDLIAALLDRVDRVAEIPRAMRSGASVVRTR